MGPKFVTSLAELEVDEELRAILAVVVARYVGPDWEATVFTTGAVLFIWGKYRIKVTHHEEERRISLTFSQDMPDGRRRGLCFHGTVENLPPWDFVQRQLAPFPPEPEPAPWQPTRRTEPDASATLEFLTLLFGIIWGDAFPAIRARPPKPPTVAGKTKPELVAGAERLAQSAQVVRAAEDILRGARGE